MSAEQDSDQDSNPNAVTFRNEDKELIPDLLSYKNMMLTQSLWARTDTGWLSMLALALLAVGIILGCSLLMNMLNLYG